MYFVYIAEWEWELLQSDKRVMEANRRNSQKTWRTRVTKEIIQNMQVSLF